MDQWIGRALDWFAPDNIVFSRYSGPHSATIVDWARRNGVPVIYHIDDDLLGVPLELGERKYAYHNAPERLQAVRDLLQQADLVYTSTAVLRQRLLGHLPEIQAIAGPINVVRNGDEAAKARQSQRRWLHGKRRPFA